ncbi:GTP-binding protein [Maribacter aestuarii]|uniref:GTP-binding protein n=1 Tax=Maribacter aestuarii TaxID=1130723 RepID=UPI00248AA924|nr:GTP-binding protein [Maribacter aestuarii]
MKVLSNDIVLRPRFQLELPHDKEKILALFEVSLNHSFVIKRIDDHVFIKLNPHDIHFWSPQLHLEINELDDGKGAKLYGLFGPNPTLWTFFIFLHFGVATIFIVLGIWAYSSWALNKPYGLQLGLMGFLVVLWFALYFFGRIGKKKGEPQMRALYNFMIETISNH